MERYPHILEWFLFSVRSRLALRPLAVLVMIAECSIVSSLQVNRLGMKRL
jgi:hypothetical protein